MFYPVYNIIMNDTVSQIKDLLKKEFLKERLLPSPRGPPLVPWSRSTPPPSPPTSRQYSDIYL